jgi:hypothetical protein
MVDAKSTMVFALKAALEVHCLEEGGGQAETTRSFVEAFFKRRNASATSPLLESEPLISAPLEWVTPSTRGRKWAEISDSE